MHGRPREIGKTAGVIKVQMGRYDVADVGHAETQIRNLAKRRLGNLEPRAGRGAEQESKPLRIGDVLDAKPAVDKNEPLFALDQQAVAAHRRRRPWTARASEQALAARAHRPAIEM